MFAPSHHYHHPALHHANALFKQNKDRDASKQRDHHAVRHHGIKIASGTRLPDAFPVCRQGRTEQQRGEARGKGERRGQAVVPEGDAEKRGPAVRLVGAHANLSQRLRHVDAELVRN